MFTGLLNRFHASRSASRWGRTLSVSVAVGILAGLAAVALEGGLHYASARLVGRIAHTGSADVLQFRWAVLLLPVLGGLMSGIIVNGLFGYGPAHGVDQYTRAFHRSGGRMDAAPPLVRATAAVGVISCGGSAGPEGPIAAVGASIGSFLSQRLGLTPRERRIFLVAGCAAGVGAVFRCPLGGALFAANVLYREPDFEHQALVPALVSSVIGYTTFTAFWGFGYMLPGAQDLVFTSPLELLPYLTLAVACGAVSIFFALALRTMERVDFNRLRVPVWAAPGLGGLAVGLMACALPQVMDAQYRFIEAALSGDVFTSGGLSSPMEAAASAAWLRWAALFALVALAKCVATAFTVGSGASGGVLGPSVFIGGATGAAVGALFEALMPGAFPENLRAALIAVGMAGVLSAGMCVPLPAIVMVTEMTGSYGLIVPLMLVCAISYVIGRRWGLNVEQVRSAVESPAHAGDAVITMLETTRVADLMQSDWPDVARPTTTLGELVAGLRAGTRPHIAVLDNDRLAGLISLNDLRAVPAEGLVSEAVIAEDLMTRRPQVAQPDDDLYQAVHRLRLHNHDALPVVDEGHRFLGMLTRERIHEAIQERLDEMRRHLLAEHEGLAAIDQDRQLQALIAGLSPEQRGTVQRMNVPTELVGQSLRSSGFRAAYRCEVVAVQTGDGRTLCPPDPDRPLTADDLLVVLSLPVADEHTS
jgi:CIC family chloride channel protein